MSDMYDNYRLIEAAKVRSVERIEKIERNSGAEDYYAGFSEYHRPRFKEGYERIFIR